MSFNETAAPVEEPVICDPSQEVCGDFKNTIELDYRTPNLMVGAINIAFYIGPMLLQRYYLANKDQTTLDTNQYYQWGYNWMIDGMKVIWGPSSFLWLINQVFYSDGFSLALLVWWSTMGSFFFPLYAIVGYYLMVESLWKWDSAWEPGLTCSEVAINALAWLVVGGGMWLQFYQNWNLAIFYWDEYLQEEHEEVVQFGKPEVEDEEEGTSGNDDIAEEGAAFESSTDVFTM